MEEERFVLISKALCSKERKKHNEEGVLKRRHDMS